MQTGHKIAELRIKAELTQEQLAERMCLTRQAISNWENGRNMPDLSMFKPLCDELGVSINDLMNGEIVKEEDREKVLEENMKIINKLLVYLF